MASTKPQTVAILVLLPISCGSAKPRQQICTSLLLYLTHSRHSNGRSRASPAFSRRLRAPTRLQLPLHPPYFSLFLGSTESREGFFWMASTKSAATPGSHHHLHFPLMFSLFMSSARSQAPLPCPNLSQAWQQSRDWPVWLPARADSNT